MTAARVVRATAADERILRELFAANHSAYDAGVELRRAHAVVWLAGAESLDPSGFLLGWEIVDELEILDVFVLPTARRQGLAAALLEHALAHARDGGRRAALLEVRTGNLAARRLYQRHGFVEVGERKRYYADGEDALLLRVEL